MARITFEDVRQRYEQVTMREMPEDVATVARIILSQLSRGEGSAMVAYAIVCSMFSEDISRQMIFDTIG